jgi:hypothetical protein
MYSSRCEEGLKGEVYRYKLGLITVQQLSI